MFWAEKKISARVGELSEYRYRDAISLAPLRFQWDEEGLVGACPPEEGEWKAAGIGDRWTGRDRYAWIACNADIPSAWRGRRIIGRFNFGKSGWGNNQGFESLLYVNGIPYHGVDTNHQEVILSGELAGTTAALRFRVWSGLEGMEPPGTIEHQIRRAELAWLDEAADDLYFTAKAALDTIEVLPQDQAERAELLKALDRAFLAVDWSRPGSGSFYSSVEEANSILHAEIESIGKSHQVSIQCIGHTHIDVAWLWRLRHTREKCARSFSTVLRLMELYPEYYFLQTQPQLYEYIKDDYPEIYSQIRMRVQEGRWEAQGGMWLEADCNLTSGESLVRQLLLGTRFLRSEFGAECTYLWLPDVFGYSWALPQILKKSGIETFMTTKISWNEYNRLPHDTFLWKGIDGSEVLTHFITAPGNLKESVAYSYFGEMKAEELQGAWILYQDKPVNRELLYAYGHGDGGGGVSRDMLELRRRFESMPGIPHVKTGRADDYFNRLRRTVAETDQYVHKWDGELFLEYHRGTYTSQAYNKRMNRKLELLYRETEWLCVLQILAGSASDSSSGFEWAEYPSDQLNNGWKIILRNQFHDIIPGTSIREVYEDSRLEYAEADRTAQEAWCGAARAIVKRSEAHEFTVFNSASWERADIAAISAESGMEEGRWVDAQGNELEAQRSGGDWLVRLSALPSMGFERIAFHPQPESGAGGLALPLPFEYCSGMIVTPYYDIEWDECGQLTRIYDRGSNRSVLADGERGNVLQVFEDKPLRFDAWNIDQFYQEKRREITQLQRVELMESGPLRAVVRFEWSYMESVIQQDMIVYSGSRRIDFKTKIDWHEKQQLLKAAFPVNVRSTEATYDIQFGNVKRPTHWNTSWDYARFETVAHQWIDLSERGYGVSLLNDCKYGHDVKEHVMRLTLIKSAVQPDQQADQGEHVFTYSLYPHAGDWFDAGTANEAWQLNNPLTYMQGSPGRGNRFSLCALSAQGVMIDAVKKAEDRNALILRMHEFGGARKPVEVYCGIPIRSWQECDLMERPIGPASEAVSEAIRLEIKPYEIRTLIVDF